MRRLVAVLLSMSLLATGGCGPAIRGGPPSTLDVPADTSDTDRTSKMRLSLAGRDLLLADTDAKRNDVLGPRLVLIDQVYETYVSNLRRDKAIMDLATGLAGLAIGVAGTLTDGVTAKTNYAAAGTLLSGGVAIVDQTLFYEQTVLALVAAMDASRAQVRLTIETGMTKDLDTYPGRDAFRDLQAYERAGTLLAAISYVSATSRGIQSDAEADLKNVRDIVKLSPQQIDLKACSTRSLFTANPKRTAPALLKAAQALGVTVDDADKSDADKIAAQLRALNRDADPAGVAKINKALADAGVLNDCTS
ncbi:hypothetical protein [Tahibacter sp.]|uniref:hypothetical protein n=1 Tax=Tahibacter sp. TaxID=2056211 RepID=UPI0028C4B1AF|nr:hypothetical protein [Tahibacter sp.]